MDASAKRSPRRVSSRNPLLSLLLVAVAATPLLFTGCRTGPVLLSPVAERPIDRRFVEYPTGFELKPHVRNLTAPVAIAFDAEQSLIIAEGGVGEDEPRIFGYKLDGRRFDVYPSGRRIPWVSPGFRIYGPIGGMVVDQGRIFVSHRDADDRGVITAFGYDGSHRTVVAGLPARGDHAVTDLAINPANGRLYFGVGSATNSGVVGIDDWQVGWVRNHPDFCDVPFVDLRLLGYRFDTRNPRAGLLGGADVAVTAPFQPFNTSKQLRIHRARNGKPTAAVYSVDPSGGGLRVEAHGIRNPVGLQFNEFGRLYMTNQGMQLRGTRPVKDDPDVILWLVPGAWYGWPDFSADLFPIGNDRFQPPQDMIIQTGYPELSSLIDHEASGLIRPDRSNLLRGVFPSLSGAGKFDFAPGAGDFRPFHGHAIIALSGDRAPFATSGRKLVCPQGYRVVRVDVETKQVRDFIKNTQGLPASRMKDVPDALERPIDVKFGPDGAMYIVDVGQLEIKGGRERARPHTGKIFRLTAIPEHDTPAPSTDTAR